MKNETEMSKNQHNPLCQFESNLHYGLQTHLNVTQSQSENCFAFRFFKIRKGTLNAKIYFHLFFVLFYSYYNENIPTGIYPHLVITK